MWILTAIILLLNTEDYLNCFCNIADIFCITCKEAAIEVLSYAKRQLGQLKRQAVGAKRKITLLHCWLVLEPEVFERKLWTNQVGRIGNRVKEKPRKKPIENNLQR